MNPFVINLAYKFVALTLMLNSVNFFCDSVNLQLDHPINTEDVRNGSNFGPPQSAKFTGSVVTDQYFFGFVSGHLANFNKLEFSTSKMSNTEIQRRNTELSKHKCLIDTNGAYQIATNWLTKMGLDVASAETKYHPIVEQWRFSNGNSSDKLETNRIGTLLPVFEVTWQGPLVLKTRTLPNRAVISMTISGITKELLAFHLLDDSLFLRPKIQINEPEKLLLIKDEDFKKFDNLQRSNLVFQATK